MSFSLGRSTGGVQQTAHAPANDLFDYSVCNTRAGCTRVAARAGIAARSAATTSATVTTAATWPTGTSTLGARPRPDANRVHAARPTTTPMVRPNARAMDTSNTACHV